jgi:hypothetical protein
MQHRVIGDVLPEFRLLRHIGQLAIKQQVADLEEVALLGQLLDGIAAMEQDSLLAIDMGEVGLVGAR